MKINNFTAYIFFDKDRDWESELVIDPKELEGVEGWYLGGAVHSIEEVFKLMENKGFDHEYIYCFLEDIPHWIYDALNKEN